MRLAFDFETGRQGFDYEPDVFRFTQAPEDTARGTVAAGGGHDGSRGLKLTLGGAEADDMSGAWSTDFTLDAAQDVTVSFRYKLTQSGPLAEGATSDLLVGIDGRLAGQAGKSHVARLVNEGEEAGAASTGWRVAVVELGRLEAGEHRLDFGGHMSGHASAAERTVIRFDDIVVEGHAAGTAVAGIALSKFEARVLDLTNEARAEHGRAPLVHDAKLAAAATDWSAQMAVGDFFAHSTPAQVEAFGYDWRHWGENIAAGQTTPEAVVAAWLDSPGHKANILNPSFTSIGIGHHHLPDDRGEVNYGHYWTQVFGAGSDALA